MSQSAPILALSTNNDDGHLYETIVVDNTMNTTVTRYSKSGKPLLSKEVSEYLNEWISSPDHMSNPYPNDEEKRQILRDTGIDKEQLQNWFKNYRSRSKRKCSHGGCNQFIQVGGFCKKHRSSRDICKCTGCEKNVHKGGVCEEHWATSSNKCSHDGCDNFRKIGCVCIKHADADDICRCTGCEKNVHKDGHCEEHWAKSARKCSIDGCDNFRHDGGVCKTHADGICEQFAKHIPILAGSLASIFCRFDYEHARSSASIWDDLKNGDNSDNSRSPPLLPEIVRFITTTCLIFELVFVEYSLDPFPSCQDHSNMKLSDAEFKLEARSCLPDGSKLNPELNVIRPLHCVLSDVRAQKLQIDTLRVPFEKRLRFIYQLGDCEFTEPPSVGSNDCDVRPCHRSYTR
jgi:hypothetical protein